MPSDDLTMGDSTLVELRGPDGKLKGKARTVVQQWGPPQRTVVMTMEERAERPKVRPVRTEYQHARCNKATRLGQGIAETFAINPTFYATTYCVHCACHFPVSEFLWLDGPLVGS